MNIIKITLLFCSLALSACQSTATNKSVSSAAKPASLVTKKANAIASYNTAAPSDINEEEAFSNLAMYFSSQLQTLETTYGQVYYFTADGEGDELSSFSLPDLYPVAMDSIAKTCNGKIVQSSYFAEIANASDFELTAYFESPEQHRKIKEYLKGQDHYANTGKKNSFIFHFFNELSLNDSQVFYPNQASYKNEVTVRAVKGGPVNCIENGEYKFYSYMLLASPSSKHEIFNHRLVGVLIPSDTANNMISEIAQQSWLAVEGGIAKKEARQRAYEAIVREDKLRWDNRHSTKLYLGNKVCSWDNKYGYIEEVGQKNVKVLWKAKIYDSVGRGFNQIDYPPGFFFGRSTLRNYRIKFRARPLDIMEWVPKAQIGSCTFS